MVQILGLVLLSFFVISVLLVPFINILYKIKFQRQKQKTRDIFEVRTPIFDKLHAHKIGTPVGGGALIIFVVTILYLLAINLIPTLGIERTAIYPYKKEVQILIFTFLSFGLLGAYDDLRKTFGFKKTKFWGLRFRYKFLAQWILATLIAAMLFWQLGIDIVNVRFFDVVNLGYFYIPFAAFVIVAFANAVNVSDGLDGLASGLLSFGATLAVSGLLLGKPIALAIIGGMFVVEISSSLLQLLSKKLRGRKIFEVAPVHLWLQLKGWPEAKIVSRFWLAQVMLAVLGLWLSFF